MIPRRYASIVCSSIVGGLACWFIPGSSVERYAFLFTTIPFSGSESVIDGDGSFEKPYAHKSTKPLDFNKINQPIDIAITDDPNQIFQSSPPSPVDFAMILNNLRRLKQDSIAIGIPLTWTEPEAIPLAALDKQLDSIQHLITSAPLSRGATPSPIPPSFRRASIPLSQLHGNTALVPVVNRIPIPGVLLGNDPTLPGFTSFAGFTTLESEPDQNSLPLIAIWDDRVVLSFHLLAALNHLQIPPSSIEIHLGRHIYLGKKSHYIPIDNYGRLSLFPEPFKKLKTQPFPAEDLLDATEQTLPKQSFKPLVIRSTHSAQDLSSMEFSNNLIQTITLLSNPSNGFSIKYYGSLTKDVALLFIAALLCLIFGIQNFCPGRDARVPLLALAAFIFILHFLIVHFTATWIPTLPALAAIAIAIFFTRRKTNQYRRGRFQLPW
jgi:hypothetical protein